MVIIRVKIVYINVLMRLVSRRGGSLNSSWTPRQVLRESKVLALIINIKYFEIIHLITLLTINTNHYENKQTIVVSCHHTDDASYHTSIESRAN